MEAMQLEIMAEHMVATMYTYHIVQDETRGVTYMDMVTTSISRVALSGSCLVVCPSGPTIEDVTNLPSEGKDGKLPIGRLSMMSVDGNTLAKAINSP